MERSREARLLAVGRRGADNGGAIWRWGATPASASARLGVVKGI
jgi:hypothetical protein